MTVADPQAFVDDENSAPAMATAIASLVNVLVEKVTVALSVGGSSRLRRLGSHLGGTVIADAEIEVADAAAGDTLVADLTALDMGDFTNETLSALEDLGVNTSSLGLVVTGWVAAPTFQVATTTPAGTESRGEPAMAFKVRGFSGVVGLLVPLFFLSNFR